MSNKFAGPHLEWILRDVPRAKRELIAGVLEGTTAAGSHSTTDMLAMIRGEPN